MKIFVLFVALILSVLTCHETFAGFWDQVQGASQKLLQNHTKTVASAPQLSQQDLVTGLKDALQVGSDTVVATLGQKDAFFKNKDIHIPLPENFKIVRNALARIGMSGMLDDLELRLNRAAETAVPKAKPIFVRTIKDMTFDDAMAIYNGADDAATRYFEKKMNEPLHDAMRPIIQDSLAQTGAVTAYDAIMGKYQTLPFVPDIKSDMTTHVLDRSLTALFSFLAKEEGAIRHDPVKRTTSILQKIFRSK